MAIVRTKEYDILFEKEVKEKKLEKEIYKWVKKHSKDKQLAKEVAYKLTREFFQGEPPSKSKNTVNVRLYYDKNTKEYKLWY